ncbi:MAG: hypothetical protein Q3M24_23015 [Candidatus Electrothrix aestuarii]|uniref:Uncharacterized protein n=1 Tax=Candidatus Electrothrix aestuarii TaxID=3062594 RepID=A0AAU8LW46_9BACT|nr:hypothetical protein [Candidatus Electrothrix aestuarii]
MKEPQSISKKKEGDSDEFEFAGLRRQGLEYAQQLSGEIWTDYNLHDPGVTILEQLCFALTDLLYRTGYAVPDLLTDANGELDYTALGMYTPEEIFPSCPVTVHDYRSILFSEIPEIENVWLENISAGENPAGERQSPSGLYRVLVAPVLDIKKNQQAEQQLKAQIEEVYARHRNLCEDIEEIVVLRPVPCHLEATLRLDGTRNAEEILAAIYHQVHREVAARLKITPYTTLAAQERPEDLFNGPLLGGRVSGLHRTAKQGSVEHGTLFQLVKSIKGIERVDRFRLSLDRAEEERIRAAGERSCYRLIVPETAGQSQVLLSNHGRKINISWTRFRSTLEKLEHNDRALRGAQSRPEQLYSLPQGTYRNPGQYSSIQHLFPDCYGINVHGVPPHYPEEEKAAAAQLKAYLLAFEQIMADYLAQLEHIPRLFSREQDLRQSYYRQQLDSSQVPGIDKVLAPEAEEYFQAVQRRFDNYRDRKGRVLDYLLALYGERFTGVSLCNFNWYLESGELEDEIIAIKSRLLQQLVQINRNRSAAPNHLHPVWEDPANISGLQQKTALLLGWEEGSQNRSLIQVFRREGLHIIDDCCGMAMSDSGREGDDRLEPVPRLDLSQASMAELREKAGPLLPGGGSITSSLLRDGARLQAYGLAVHKKDHSVRVRLCSDTSGARWLPGRFADQDEATIAVNALRTLLIRLNQESEGVHIVEHILLRPAQEEAGGVEENEEYGNRISMVLPNWTPRCGNREFQLLVEETVRINCPAHIMPVFYWLNAAHMTEFEELFTHAMTKRRCRECQGGGKAASSKGLRRFLRRHEPVAEEQFW